MDYGSVFTILFGLAFVVFGVTLYIVARRASPDRRFFRMSAYTEMVVLTITGVIFIVIGVLSSQ
jgi:heme/copper-type cytochrome/quinol oxidase subunit 2